MKILIADDEAEIREIIRFTLEVELGYETVEAATGREAIWALAAHPDIACVVCDYNMPDGDGAEVYRWLQRHAPTTPFILCSSELPASLKPAGVAACFVEKPMLVEPLKTLVARLVPRGSTAAAPFAPGYCRVPFSVLRKVMAVQWDLYLKLSDSKYVRVMKEGDSFGPDEMSRFERKSVRCVYVRRDDAADLLAGLAAALRDALARAPADAAFDAGATMELSQSAIEAIRSVGLQIGFGAEAQELIQGSIALIRRTLRQNERLAHVLERLRLDPDSYIASHSAVLAHVAPGIASLLGWTSEGTFGKLALAAFLHDLPLPDDAAAKIDRLDGAICDGSALALPYDAAQAIAEHPRKAAELARSIPGLPADLDVILLQHHERPDGQGFPDGIPASRFAPLAAVFVVAHDLVSFIGARGPGWKLDDFIAAYEAVYTTAEFRRILEALRRSAGPGTAAA